jgi:hypothetical protein
VVETYPAIASADNGAAYIAFQSDKTAPRAIYFTENTSGSFAGPFLVTVGHPYQPAIDVTPDGKIVLAYQDSLDGTFSDIYMRLSVDGGHVWANAQVVSTSQDRYQIAPDVECTSEGDVHVAWHEEDDQGRPGKVYYREFVKLLAGWQDVFEVVGENGMGGFPSMDGDSNGHIHMVYELMTPADPPAKDNYEIWYRSSVP